MSSYASFKIVQPAMQRTKFFPEYLLKNMENYKSKNAEYPLTKDDDNATEFLKKVHDKKLIVKNQVTNIYRVKRANKVFTCYGLNMIAYDDDGNKIDEFYHIYGWEIHPQIKAMIKGNQEVLVPDGYRIEHNIPFNSKEVDKVIKLCDDEYKENINFVYCEIPLESKAPVNENRTYLIKSEQIFKNATNDQISKIIKKGANEIEDLSQLETFIPIKSTIANTLK